jgi:hypothetical protein
MKAIALFNKDFAFRGRALDVPGTEMAFARNASGLSHRSMALILPAIDFTEKAMALAERDFA